MRIPPRPARRLAAAVALALCARGAGAQRAPAAPDAAQAAIPAVAARLLADIRYLASDALEGRFTGSPGADSAAAFVARRFAALRLRPVVVSDEDAARCASVQVSSAERAAAGAPRGPAAPADYPPCAGWMQRFDARSAALAHAGRGAPLATQNVVGLVEGTDPALRGQVVVVGAHYDHLGRETMFATDPKAGAVIHNGADDNASGVAAVLELARRLKARPARRSVLFVAFSGEELGLLGSRHFLAHSPVPTDSMAAMLNFDMVGRLQPNDRLLVYGTATAAELPALVDSANAAGPRLAVRALGDGTGPSDHASFYLAGMPVLHFFTDQHPDYHAATDDADKINAPGAARVVALAEGVLRRVADRAERLTFTRAPTTPRMAQAGPEGRPRPWLGSVPDMGGEDGLRGLRLQGVTPDSPADKGGLRAGDVVVELDGKPVTDLYTYTEALYARAPGDTVAVVVLRGGANGAAPERVRAQVTLGRRGE